MEIGPVISGGMASAPVTFGEIAAWQTCMGVRLEPWECSALREMSLAYVAESVRASVDGVAAPWAHEITPDERREVALRLRSEMRGG